MLKDNSIISSSWIPAKLFIIENYTDNANKDVPLTVETEIFFVSLSLSCADFFFGRLINRFLYKNVFILLR